MRSILDIYDKYEIPENLREHMLRVAGVCGFIIDHTSVPLNSKIIIETALTHDLGNILKFDLNVSKKYYDFSVEQLEKINKAKEKYSKIYGNDCDAMTRDILTKENLNPKISELLRHFVFEDVEEIEESKMEDKKILKYADLRVGMTGIISLEDRINDAIPRYPGVFTQDRCNASFEIEKTIFLHSNIKPKDITDEAVAPYIEKLKEFEI